MKGKEKIKRMIQASLGFTLVEVLIAVFLLSFGILAAVQMQASGVRYNAMGRDLTNALSHAQSRMEEIMALRYEQVVEANFPDDRLENNRFLRHVTVVDTGALKNVQVTVTWSAGGNLNRRCTLDSIISPTLASTF